MSLDGNIRDGPPPPSEFEYIRTQPEHDEHGFELDYPAPDQVEDGRWVLDVSRRLYRRAWTNCEKYFDSSEACWIVAEPYIPVMRDGHVHWVNEDGFSYTRWCTSLLATVLA